jgi:hypothetical protein
LEGGGIWSKEMSFVFGINTPWVSGVKVVTVTEILGLEVSYLSFMMNFS